LLWRRLPKTGSTVAKRRVIISLPLGLSILHFIRAVYVSGLPAVGPRTMATCRTGILSGYRRQRARTVQRPQAVLRPVNFSASKPFRSRWRPLR
jgi:hypothetical protein